MASYSRITRNMANVLYRACRSGEIEMTDAAVRMVYGCADARINHDDCWNDVEARIAAAVDCAMNGDMAGCQREVDEACAWHDRHWCDKVSRAVPEAIPVEGFEPFDEDGFDDMADDGLDALLAQEAF